MKRVITLLLCAAMCLSLFCGCNSGTKNPDSQNGGQNGGETRDTVVIALTAAVAFPVGEEEKSDAR